MPTLIFDPAAHIYTLDGRRVPSVTEIVSPITAAKYKDSNPALIAQAQQRGTDIHRLCQLIDVGCPVEDIEVAPELSGYVTAYLRFLRDYKPEWELIEKPVYYDGDKYPYAGTLDRYGRINGKCALVDIKSTAVMDRLSRAAVLYQLELYDNCLETCAVFNSFALQLKKDGNYKIYRYYDLLKEANKHSALCYEDLIKLTYLIGGYEKNE